MHPVCGILLSKPYETKTASNGQLAMQIQSQVEGEKCSRDAYLLGLLLIMVIANFHRAYSVEGSVLSLSYKLTHIILTNLLDGFCYYFQF